MFGYDNPFRIEVVQEGKALLFKFRCPDLDHEFIAVAPACDTHCVCLLDALREE